MCQNCGGMRDDAYATNTFEACGNRGGDIDTSTAQAETYQDPVGFGGQWGYYTDAETGLVCLTHRHYDGDGVTFSSPYALYLWDKLDEKCLLFYSY